LDFRIGDSSLITKRIAIIPARGGSKRIPKKNIKPFAGKPIICYSIAAAQASGLIDSVLVSTDNSEIANVAREAGAEIPFLRPIELSDDLAGTDDVLLHTLNWLESHGRLPEYICCIYATAPFLRADDIRGGWASLSVNDCSCAFSVTTFPYCIFRALNTDLYGRIKMIWPDNLHKRSQDLPEAFHDAGMFYWANVCKYRQAKTLYYDALPIMIPRWRAQDIDTQEDWDLAERLFLATRG